MEDITDADFAHAKRICKDFEIKKLRMLLMVKEVLEEEHVNLFIDMQKLITST